MGEKQTEDGECLTCNGRGGKLHYNSDGDGTWAMTYEQARKEVQ